MENIITCYNCGDVTLTQEQYDYQMDRPNSVWICPTCGSHAMWKGQFERCADPDCGGWVQIDGDGVCNTCGTDSYEWYMEHHDGGDNDPA